MANMATFNSKTIDELQQLGKLSGHEMLVVSVDGQDTRKISLDSIVGYAAAVLSGSTSPSMPAGFGLNDGGTIHYIPEGETIDISERSPGCFYLEEQKQTSIRTNISLPTSVKVSSSLGLRRL